LPTAYLLISHGSRDPRPQVAIAQLAQQFQATLAQSPLAQSPLAQGSLEGQAGGLVETAVLELGPSPLHQQIQQVAARAVQAGYDTLKLVPLFLLQGVHVMEDIPAEVKLAQQELEQTPDSQIEILVCPYLGSHKALWKLLALDDSSEHLGEVAHQGRILLAHGSRRPASQQHTEIMATQLEAIPAYWSVQPDLETQVTQLIQQGVQQIAILPYFLFEGGITDAIAQTVEQLRQAFPDAQIHLGQPFGTSPHLANLLVDLVSLPATYSGYHSKP
jgi:sirohydrochlorin cobaltochelatase